MTNNDILRRLRYAFDFSDSKMIALFGLADLEVTREQVSAWLKKDDDPTLEECGARELAVFLNGFIHDKRGKREDAQAEPERRLNNNIVFRKLKIALNLKDDDMLKVLSSTGFRFSKSELSAFFRKPDHKHYRVCKDQVLRNFLSGLALQYRTDIKPPKESTKSAFKWE
ncbi:MAG: DUF1456 family protein [Mariprofundaceae bacterium]|nr:DUF1456 family protein [Mariprofundaceae bacterium]